MHNQKKKQDTWRRVIVLKKMQPVTIFRRQQLGHWMIWRIRLNLKKYLHTRKLHSFKTKWVHYACPLNFEMIFPAAEAKTLMKNRALREVYDTVLLKQ